jgi:hypothetical protein
MRALRFPVGERVRFGRDIPPAVNALLQQAAASTHDFTASERALLAARELAPAQLEVLIALYKLYFYRGHIGQAEQVVIETLYRAAHKGGFDPDWRCLDRASTDWRDASGPGRAYLYSLKALSFIRLRCNDRPGAEELLAALRRLDPHDRVGAGVVGDLAAALEDA